MNYLSKGSKIMAAVAMISIVSTTAFAEGNDAEIGIVHAYDFAASTGSAADAKAVGEPASATGSPSVSASLAVTGTGPTTLPSTPVGPSHLRDLVRQHADANGVPFPIADAVVRVESRYNPGVASRGNFGLMQIRLQTARGVGYGGSAAGLLNADTNARYGMKYLAQAYRMAGGDMCRTVMKYQSGHGATSMSGANRAYCSKVRTIVARN